MRRYVTVLCVIFLFFSQQSFAKNDMTVDEYKKHPDYVEITIKAGDVQQDPDAGTITFRNCGGLWEYPQPDSNLYRIDSDTDIAQSFNTEALIDGSEPWISIFILETDLQAYNTGITVHVAFVWYNSFNDSSDSEIRIQHPEREVFTRLDRLGIMTMDPVSGDFQPLNFLTRAEAAKIVVAMRAVENPVSEAGVFSEVPSDHWAYPYVGTALEWGIVSGTGDGIFQPDREITHSEFMKMLVSLLGK